jgi:hypothetical protein
MHLRHLGLALAGGAVLITASSIAFGQQETQNSKATEQLSKALAGRTAGVPVSCIGNRRNTDMQVIDDRTILFRESGTVYLQKPRSACYGLGTGSITMVTRINASSRLCSGQIAELVDRVSGFPYGSCVFSEFIPYKKAGE